MPTFVAPLSILLRRSLIFIATRAKKAISSVGAIYRAIEIFFAQEFAAVGRYDLISKPKIHHREHREKIRITCRAIAKRRRITQIAQIKKED